MAELTPPNRNVSLDDLLEANKARFDRIFETRMRESEGLDPAGMPFVAPAPDPLGGTGGEDGDASPPGRGAEPHVPAAGPHLPAAGTEDAAGESTAGSTGRARSRRTGPYLAARRPAGSLEPHPASNRAAGPAGLHPTAHRSADPARSPDGRASAALSSAPHEEAARSGRAPARPSAAPLDPVTLDLIENALRNARHEMDAVLFRSAMSPVIREQHDEFPMITDPQGRMIVGQFGSYVPEMLAEQAFELEPGDVILQSDPYRCGGAISHINDWMVLIPIFFQGELVGFSSMFGHMMDVGGPVPGSMPTAATSIFGEGIRIPPIKIHSRGRPNEAALAILMNNTRTPEMNYSDLMAIIAGSRTGEKRVIEICERFGADTYRRACEALLDRTHRAMRTLIVKNLPTEPQSFEDWIDDDGVGNGPFRMKLTVWREGEHAYFDWTGTDPQAPGPINFYLHEGMFKMFIGVYMIMVFDPQILFNDGFYDLIHVTLPKGSLVHPDFPAALGCRTHALARQFDVLGGALSRHAPEMATAAGYGSSPHFLYSGTDRDGRPFQLMEILYGGIPGRPIGDGMDGHSWWPLFENIPSEYLESYYPMIIEGYASLPDTGGAGRHRGGNGVEKVYRLLEPGEISIHDDRHRSRPWGILGGRPGAVSEKWLIRAGSERREPLESKVDHVKVAPGDRIVFRTAGGGGWGDPLERDPARVRADVRRKLMSAQKAERDYGVVLAGDALDPEAAATEARRESIRRSRGPLPTYDFGEPDRARSSLPEAAD